MNKTNDEILNFLESCSSKQKAFRYFGIDTNQSYTKQNEELKFICDSVGFDIERLNCFVSKAKKKEDYSINPKRCLNCGTPISYKDRLKKKFCNSSCAAKYNNSHRDARTEESKKKTSDSLKRLYDKDPERFFKNPNNCLKDIQTLDGSCVRTDMRGVSDLYYANQISFDDVVKTFPDLIRKCKSCNKEFVIRTKKNKRLSNETTCSDECKKELWKEKGKETYKRIKAEGRFQGWKSRKIKSYAELFWEKVLDNNNILYTREYYYEKYFIDFKIDVGETILDLEIDGKQHEYEDRKESDKVRDEFFKSKGVVVYRVKWNEINSEKGSEMMKEKIDSFITFYNNLKK